VNRGSIDAIVQRATPPLRKERARRAWRRSLAGSGTAFILGAGLFLLLRQSGFALGLFPAAILVIGGPALLWVGGCWLAGLLAPVARGEALERVEAAVHARGRLRAADDFLARGPSTAFMQAAVEDAERFVETAQRAPLPRAADAPVVWSWREPALAAALVLLGWLLPSVPSPFERAPREVVAGTDAEVSPRRSVSEEARRAERRAPPETTPAGKRDARRDKSRTASSDRYATDDTEATRGTRARSRAGQPGEGGSASKAAGAPGSPSEQDPAVKKVEKPKSTKAPVRRDPPKEAPPSKPSDSKQKSGMTAGRGSKGGSTRNPTTSNWSSKDKVPDDDQKDLESDDDVEDEDSDSEARGGVQPNLRDRKPPVNRDLAIGFGNRPSPQANGRGGPSQRKKSRGTASLVLGVPIPDHVRGNPSPGRTKVTQERVEPRAEESEPASAAARGRRNAPIGSVATPDTSPWLQRILKEYFLALRADADASAAASSKDSE